MCIAYARNLQQSFVPMHITILLTLSILPREAKLTVYVQKTRIFTMSHQRYECTVHVKYLTLIKNYVNTSHYVWTQCTYMGLPIRCVEATVIGHEATKEARAAAKRTRRGGTIQLGKGKAAVGGTAVHCNPSVPEKQNSQSIIFRVISKIFCDSSSGKR